MLREVTYLPSRPAKESLTWKVMLTVGSSTDRGHGLHQRGSHRVSEIFRPSIPVMQTISPASANSISSRSSPR